jgi:HAD superfamily hydrolase (TIGR01509 family)
VTPPKAKQPPRAVLFDIDGTLVDSNYLHVVAWIEAFRAVGCPVDAWRIHRAIGMDSAKLLSELLGDRAADAGEQATAEHARRYKELSGLLRPFEGARELLREVAAGGAKVVLATSAPPDELQMLRRVLDVEDAVDVVTNADDVETAKPAPGIVQIALDRAQTSASDAVFVGDAVWDVKAANGAGVACIGVLSGGTAASDLACAGAVATYDTVRELLKELDESRLSRNVTP